MVYKINNTWGSSVFALFTWKYISNNSGYISSPRWTKLFLTICCLFTGIIILGKILYNLFGNTNSAETIITNLFNIFSTSGGYYGGPIVAFCITSLIIGLYAVQIYGLTFTLNEPHNIKYGAWALVLLFTTVVSIMFKNPIWLLVSIIGLIIYYILLIIILTHLDCPDNPSSENPFEKNCYIAQIGVPMTFIILALLFAYVICMSILRVFSKKSDNCEGKFTSLRKCIGGLKDTLAVQSNKSQIQKLVADLDKIQKTLRGFKQIDVKHDSYKNIMAIIIINIIVILSGFNILLWFIRPEIFITLLVIQRLWFGSTYSTTANGNTLDITGKGDTKKSWDLIGMPLVRWAMYLSNIDGDVTHKILYGETNRKTFQPLKTYKPDNPVTKALSSLREGVTGIDPNKPK